MFRIKINNQNLQGNSNDVPSTMPKTQIETGTRCTAPPPALIFPNPGGCLSPEINLADIHAIRGRSNRQCETKKKKRRSARRARRFFRWSSLNLKSRRGASPPISRRGWMLRLRHSVDIGKYPNSKLHVYIFLCLDKDKFCLQ